MDRTPAVPPPPFRKQLKFLKGPKHVFVLLRKALVFQVTEQSLSNYDFFHVSREMVTDNDYCTSLAIC